MSARRQERQEEDLEQEATHILEECRMVLPGIQALFGFQLIAVFNPTFSEKLSSGEQLCHLLAIALVSISTGLVLTPAAYHRQVEPAAVSKTFVHMASQLIAWALLLLSASLAVDFYLIARLILEREYASLLLALALFAAVTALWFGFPRVAARYRR